MVRRPLLQVLSAQRPMKSYSIPTATLVGRPRGVLTFSLVSIVLVFL